MDKNERIDYLSVEEKLFYDELIEIKEALKNLHEIKNTLALFINGKSQKLREYIDKIIVIENDTGQIKGTLISVTDNWIEIQWESESPAEDKSGITFMAIDHITAFCLAREDEKPKIKVDLPEFDQEGLKEKIIKVAKPNGQTS